MKSSRVWTGGKRIRQKVHLSSASASKCATLAPTASALFRSLKINSLKSFGRKNRFHPRRIGLRTSAVGTSRLIMPAKVTTVWRRVGSESMIDCFSKILLVALDPFFCLRKKDDKVSVLASSVLSFFLYLFAAFIHTLRKLTHAVTVSGSQSSLKRCIVLYVTVSSE